MLLSLIPCSPNVEFARGARHCSRLSRRTLSRGFESPAKSLKYLFASTTLAPVAFPGSDGNPAEGSYVGELLIRRLNARSPPRNFRYRNYGNLATIGRKSAIVDFGWMHVSGLLRWLTWGAAHIFFLIGFRSRVMVMLSWLWSYFTTEYGARLITGKSRKQ